MPSDVFLFQKPITIILTVLLLLINWAVLALEVYNLYHFGIDHWKVWRRPVFFGLFFIPNLLFTLGLLLKSTKLLLPLVTIYKVVSYLCFNLGLSQLVVYFVILGYKYIKSQEKSELAETTKHGIFIAAALLGVSVWTFCNYWVFNKAKVGIELYNLYRERRQRERFL